jgi:hypothetical protein
VDLALGFKPHTGWAIAVVVGGSPAAPTVVDRRRVLLCPDRLPRMAYHAAQDGPRADAARLIEEVDAAVLATTTEAVDELVAASDAHGTVVAAGLIGTPRDLPELDAALASHALLHSAEGELYRAALETAVDRCDLPVVPVEPKATIAEAAAALGVAAPALTARLAALRADLGAPWQADHKDATAAALLALHLHT